MKSLLEEAPGAPGIPPTWCSSAKEIVGCALGPSRLLVHPRRRYR